MNWITETRRDLANTLETLAPTHVDVPEILDLPAIILTEADSFLERGAFGSWDVAFKATYYTRPGDNDVMAEDADSFAAGLLQMPLPAAIHVQNYQTVTLPDGQPLYAVTATITLNKEES